MSKKPVVVSFRGYDYTTYTGFYKAVQSGRWDDINTDLSYDALRTRITTGGYTPEKALQLGLNPKKRTYELKKREWKPPVTFLNQKWVRGNTPITI